MVALETVLKPTIAEDRTRAFGSLCVTRSDRRVASMVKLRNSGCT